MHSDASMSKECLGLRQPGDGTGQAACGQGWGLCLTFPALLQGGETRCCSPLQALSLALESVFHGISWLVSMGCLEEKGRSSSWFAACCCAPPLPHQHPLLGTQEQEKHPQGLWPQRDTPAPNLSWQKAGAGPMESTFRLSASPIPSSGALSHQRMRDGTSVAIFPRAAHNSNRTIPLIFYFFLLH